MPTVANSRGARRVVCAVAVCCLSPDTSGQTLDRSHHGAAPVLNRKITGDKPMPHSAMRQGPLLNESAKLLASDGTAGDEFGVSVAVSADVAVVGAAYDENNGIDSGSAYVFRWNGSAWVEQQKLLASDGAAGDLFGYSVSASGDTVIVGAYADDDGGGDSGSAYLYRWNGSAWLEEQKLLAADGAAGDWFGHSVAITDDVAVVGAVFDDDSGSNTGSAYVFRRDGSAWGQEQKLVASDAAPSDWFGYAVSVSGDVIVSGAYGDDDNGFNAGSAYVFRWDGSSWMQEQKLLASDGQGVDLFGIAVAVSGDVALVGASGHNNGGGFDSGSVYVFRWNGSTWAEEQNLLASDAAAEDAFGFSVSVSGNVAVVGALLDDDNGTDSGAAYLYHWNGLSWVEDQKLLASDGAAFDECGNAVSVSGSVAFVGASWTDDNGADSGAAYVFDLPPAGVPTVSQWGLVVMTLLTLAAGTIVFHRRPAKRRDQTPAPSVW